MLKLRFICEGIYTVNRNPSGFDFGWSKEWSITGAWEHLTIRIYECLNVGCWGFTSASTTFSLPRY